MRTALILLAACGGATTVAPPPIDQGDTTRAALADEDNYKPTYGKAELENALIAERGKQASAERVLTDFEARGADVATDEGMRTATNDLAVRRRFIGELEQCQASGRDCPPRLDEPAFAFDPDGTAPPPLDAPLRFDLADWQKVTTELHGRACACRTLTCVDAMSAAIDQLEPRPMPDVQGDELASQALTRARECLFRLRGRDVAPRPLDD